MTAPRARVAIAPRQCPPRAPRSTGWVSPSPCRPTSTVASITVIGVTSIASSSRRQSTLPSARSTEITVPPFTPTNADPSSTVTPVRLTPSSGTGGHNGSWLPRSNAARPDSTRPSTSASARGPRARRRGRTDLGAGCGRRPVAPSLRVHDRRAVAERGRGCGHRGTDGAIDRERLLARAEVDADHRIGTDRHRDVLGDHRAPTDRSGRRDRPGSNGVLHARRYPGSGPSAATPVFAGPPWNSVQAPATWAAAMPAPSMTGAHAAAATVRRARRDDSETHEGGQHGRVILNAGRSAQADEIRRRAARA